ncbi:MAG: GNAT family N-acetyltransferase [Oscillospiraceae bacterium]|nr:GNAT family N-acetyltransferase [Oscillospiraceae bacterium]MBQ4312391.1 GNAT family N-acetyltransferase [Oscillospiraceae bacterium]MCR5166481.1 GNAT family N-acetyltransferase [Oscillospiraceae bacterium]
MIGDQQHTRGCVGLDQISYGNDYVPEYKIDHEPQIEYFWELKKEQDIIDLYTSLEWYNLKGYTDADIERANESFCSVYAYDGDLLVGLGRVASDGIIAAVMSGVCVRSEYRRHGIGAQIVSRLADYCQTGIYKMNVQLFCEDSLVSWYEKLGFERSAMGMRKNMPHTEEPCALKHNFHEIYGVDQIAEFAPDFYWYNFDWFGEFSYYGGIGSEGVKVPFISMTLYSNEPVKFSADVIFENVSEFEIGCIGLRTPLFGFDIINTEKYGYSERKRYRIRSLEDDHIGFFCEKISIISIHRKENCISCQGPSDRRSGSGDDFINQLDLLEDI